MARDYKREIEADITSDKVVLFMKGSKEAPQCGFSYTVCQILKEIGTPYSTVDVLADWDKREAIKEYSHWPTFPQLYVKGKLIGGCDIVREMWEEGSLAPLIAEAVKN
jgi:monothiol glutaredoxin